MVVRLAVGMAVPFEEIPSPQLLVAVGAHEMFRVPCLAEGRYHLADDRLIARRTASFLSRVDALFAHVRLKTVEHAIQLRRSFFLRSAHRLRVRRFQR